MFSREGSVATRARAPQSRSGRYAPLAAKLLILVTTVARAAEPSPLEARLKPFVDAHQGKIAIAIKHLSSAETYFLNADEPMPTASLIKLPVMVEFYAQ